MSARYLHRDADLLLCGGPFLPVCFCLDTSVSMLRTLGGKPVGPYIQVGDGVAGQLVQGGVSRLERLQQMLNLFCKAVYAEEKARRMIEYAVVTYDDKPTLLRSFGRTEAAGKGIGGELIGQGMTDIPNLQAEGNHSALGEGVAMALQELRLCREWYKKLGVSCYRPWLILIGDGQASGEPDILAESSRETAALMEAGQLSLFSICLGEDGSRYDIFFPGQKTVCAGPEELPVLLTRLAANGNLMPAGEENLCIPDRAGAIPAYHTTGRSGERILVQYERKGWAQGLD